MQEKKVTKMKKIELSGVTTIKKHPHTKISIPLTEFKGEGLIAISILTLDCLRD